MKESLWGYLLISLGIIILVILFLVYNYTSADESDYYILKEATEAAMIESVDEGQAMLGYLVIDEEKFVENFVRRFSATTNINRSYRLEFMGIYEFPPKVSIRITTTTGDHTVQNDTANIPVVNIINAVLEQKNVRS